MGQGRITSGGLAEPNRYRDGVGKPPRAAPVLWCAADGLQVPHRRAEAPKGVISREAVAVPDDVSEGAGEPPVRAAAGAGNGQALRAAKSPVQVAGLGLEGDEWQLRGGQVHVHPPGLQLGGNRVLDLAVDRPEGAACLRQLRDRRAGLVTDLGALPAEEVLQELGRRGESRERESGGDPGGQGLVGGQRAAVALRVRGGGVRVLAAVRLYGVIPGDREGRLSLRGAVRSGGGDCGGRVGLARWRGFRAADSAATMTSEAAPRTEARANATKKSPAGSRDRCAASSLSRLLPPPTF